MDSSNIDLSNFLSAHQLPTSYEFNITNWFAPVAEQIIMHQKSANKTIVVGINGAQGSGKSTLAELLVFLFQRHQLNAVALSIDDFYFTHAEREQLAREVHPLLLTRGVPGTHDIGLAHTTLHALKTHKLPLHLPRFNKAVDDRYPLSEWDEITEPVDIIVLEGWCLGAEPQNWTALHTPVNDLEQSHDPDTSWRQYVNEQLRHLYPTLFNQIDIWLMLKAPSFDCVFNWRLEQENKLRQTTHQNAALDQVGLMDSETISEFIKYYQRITENTLKTLPAKVDYLFELNEDREIISFRHKSESKPQLLVFTDLDGSLLDHYNYRHDPADSELSLLEKLQIPVIPVSSKTRAEIELIRDSLHNNHPFIVENGAAVFIPKDYFPLQPEDTVTVDKYWVKSFVNSRNHWLQLIAELKPHYPDQFTTFAAAGIDGIIRMTGLNVHAAARAARRDYGEPVSWYGRESNKQQFIHDLQQLGANVLQGGRFLHVSGNCNKGIALSWLTNIYQQYSSPDKMMTLAIGDSQNDQAMLEQADYALLIRSPVNPLPHIEKEQYLYISEKTGPSGWAQGVDHILRDLAITADTIST